MPHPYDILDEFDGFRAYYRALIHPRYIPAGEVSRVVVDASNRGVGLGEILVDSLVTVASKKKLSVLFLACRASSETFYGTCGFRRVEGLESNKFIEIPEQSIVMEPEL